MKDTLPFLLDAIGTASVSQCLTGYDVELLAAGDQRFPGLVPDDYKAYIRYRIATAFPKVIGPEMHGDYFGFHPQVLANSYRSLLHQQNNIGHALKEQGARRDRIVGAVVAVDLMNVQRQAVQKISETVEQAAYIEVIAVIHKRAEGVKELIGRHMSAREKTSVSIELIHPLASTGVYDPRERSIMTIQQAVNLYPELITVRKKDNRVLLGKVDGQQFAWAPGGENGSVVFSGVGYTPRPAEGNTARVIDLAAARDDGEMLSFAAMAAEEWTPGTEVRWKRLSLADSGRGCITDVILAGSVTRNGVTKAATPDNPILEISVAGKSIKVIRTAASVTKI